MEYVKIITDAVICIQLYKKMCLILIGFFTIIIIDRSTCDKNISMLLSRQVNTKLSTEVDLNLQNGRH